MKIDRVSLQGLPNQSILIPEGATNYQAVADGEGAWLQYVDPELSGPNKGMERLTIALVKTNETVPEIPGYEARYLGSFFYKYQFHAFWYVRHDATA